ncbi:unnamed protein product [Rotaria sp. Silwood2]|nr:unnamed protein product [Rotaria sp. Silwood2]CAF3955323.1 unnamed protein product [Rotaria sp. Silwood2]
MFNLFEDQLIDDIVSRAEQSRISYNSQREEFRNLNASLQTYLGDIKTIDDNNRHLQENIHQIRTNYISTLENYLKHLLNDFRQISQQLTEVHIDRYKFKSRARRIVNEREEFKRRINFIAANEKEQIKRLNILQKKERSVRNEFLKLNEQLQNCLTYVENEKQIHQKAMNKVDSLQLQLEQICVERSKTEFEIQTLKEEVKLMQTAKDFLDDERETIIATENEANEYLLSRLDESIVRIREDFDQLNKTQLKQIENEYKQMLQILEEHFTTNQEIDELTTSHQRTRQAEHERLQEEYQHVLQDLTTLNNHNLILSKQVLAMEVDFYSLRDERIQQLTSKDNEIERTKIELQTLKEKLNQLAEYDRNLKFELTLYRGVLESEYRRKQTEQQSSINTSYLRRPTTLQANNNLMTDRRTLLTSSTNQSKFNDQQEEIVTNRDRVQSEYDTLGEDTDIQIDNVLSTKTSSKNEKIVVQEILWQPVIEPFNQERDRINVNIISQDIEKSSSSTSAVILTEDQLVPSFEVQQSSSCTFSASSETRKSSTSSTPPVIREDQSVFSPAQQLSATPSELRSLPTVPSTNQEPLPTEIAPVLFEVRQSPLISPQESQTFSEIQKSPTLSTAPTLQEEQIAFEKVSQFPSTPPEDYQTISEVPQSLSRTSSEAPAITSDIQKSPSSPTTPPPPTTEYQQSASVVHEPPSTPIHEQQPSWHVSSDASIITSDIQRSSSSPTTPPTTITEYQQLTSDVHEPSSTSQHEQEPSGHVSSDVSAIPADIQTLSHSPTTPPTTITEYQQSASVVHEPPSTPIHEQQPSWHVSSDVSIIPSDIQRSSPSPTTPPITTEYQQLVTDLHEPSSAFPQDYQSSLRASSDAATIPSDIQEFSSSATSATATENQQLASDVQEFPSTPPHEHQTSWHASSDTSTIPFDIQRSPPSPTTPPTIEYKQLAFDLHEPLSIPLEEHEVSSEIQTFPPLDDAPKTRSDNQENVAPIGADDYQTAALSESEYNIENQLSKPFDEFDDNLEHEESIQNVIDESGATNERDQSRHHIESSAIEEFETSLDTKINESQSLLLTLSNIQQDERQQSPSQVDKNILLDNDNKLELKQDDISEEMQREEEISSSLTNPTQENYTTDYFSSTIITDDHKNDNIDESNSSLSQYKHKQSSSDTLSDIQEVDLPTSQKVDITSDDDDDPSLMVIMQDLRYVFHELANDEDLVEINNDLPDRLLDRLEFHDHLIRTLFDGLLRKYLVQSAAQENRPKTLDWIEFRDILFPIITGRYTERHIRKLFDLFDTNKNGYLSLHEISELLEILQANNTISLAQNIIDEYDTDHDGKLSVDELIEAIKKTDDINEHVLSEETENKQWFNQTPIDNQTISLEVPTINFPTETTDKFSKEISLLGRIFKNVGANSDSKLLDSNIKNLSIQITNEFINNNINISNDDLQLFIELYLNKKQNTGFERKFFNLFSIKSIYLDSFINWIEFRDVFLPIVNNGYYSINGIQRWFDIFDINHDEIITQEQIIQLLHLLQIENSEEIINKFNEITETHTIDNVPWTLDELLFALDNVDETCTHLITNNEQIASFDIDWLSNNVF